MSVSSDDSIIVLSDDDDFGTVQPQRQLFVEEESTSADLNGFASPQEYEDSDHEEPGAKRQKVAEGDDFEGTAESTDEPEFTIFRPVVPQQKHAEETEESELFVNESGRVDAEESVADFAPQVPHITSESESRHLRSRNGTISPFFAPENGTLGANAYGTSEDAIVVISDDESEDNVDHNSGDEPSNLHEPGLMNINKQAADVEETTEEEDSFYDAAQHPTQIDDDDIQEITPVAPRLDRGNAPEMSASRDTEPYVITDSPLRQAPDDESSDEEIAILSKEEAERVGSFKKSSFDVSQPPAISPPVPAHGLFNQPPPIYGQNMPESQPPAFNQPAPVYHAGAQTAPPPEDLSVSNYFMNLTMPQLQTYAQKIDTQIGVLSRQIKSFYEEVGETRRKMSMLPFTQDALKEEYSRHVTERLALADSLLQRVKKTRRMRLILESVKTQKLASSSPSDPFQPGMLNLQPQLQPQPPSAYRANVNPYMQRPVNDDHTHLENLFRDLGREEKIEGMSPTPSALSIQLLDHQRRGLFWLLEKEKAMQGCILADDMGLGKTVQTLAVMAANPPLDPACKTTLIVGPVSLLRQWDAEMQAKLKPGHTLSVAFYHGQERRKLTSFAQMSQYDVILTSYTTLASEYKQHFVYEFEAAKVSHGQNALPQRGTGGQTYSSPFYCQEAVFYRIVLDEAQYIRNKLSQASKAVAVLRGKHRMCLTGTPMQNSIDELYPILRFLNAKPYDDEKKFKSDILVPLKSTSDAFDDYDRNQSMQKLRLVLSAVMLRRTKDSKVDGKPLIQLPEKTVEQVFVKMENEELEYYQALETGIQKKARKLMNTVSPSGHSNFLTLLLRLRQACIHQLLVEVGELNSHENSDSFSGTNWVQMYDRCISMSGSVKEIVRKFSGADDTQLALGNGSDKQDIQFTCPSCFDVVGEGSIKILAACGHMVCDGCVDTLFSTNDQGLRTQSAHCVTCGERAALTDIVDYVLFTKVDQEGYDQQKLETLYGMSNTRKSSNSDKVKFLIRRDAGFTPSAKMERTLGIIDEVIQDTPDEKIIIFSHFTVTFDLMGYALKQNNIEFLRYDGSMNIDDKNRTISEFYKGTPRVLLISLKAGNVGLTLTCASHVVIMDPFWNPYVEDQAMDRAHRFGQERPVKVYRLLIKNSVEDRIMDLQQRKKELIGSALDENALKSSSRLGRRELGYLFGLNSLR
ncbi:hypothetical protein OXX80_004387 [Metschnikowia pulcherrima]